jgi:hypothetical protein
MNKHLILSALEDALYLITEEYQSVNHIDLKEKYNEVIDKINEAIFVIKNQKTTITE